MKKLLFILLILSFLYSTKVMSKGIEAKKPVPENKIMLETIELQPESDNAIIYDTPENKFDSANNLITSTISSNKHKVKDKRNIFKRSWSFIKGKPADSSLLLGMFSYHTMEGRENLNETNNLAGVDCKGYTLGTFNNSYRVQTYYAGLSRKVYKQELLGGVDVDFKYKFVALYGYRDYEPDVLGITPNIIPMLGFTKGHVGIDFLVSPGKTLTFATNFRINLDNPKNNQKKKQ